MASDRNIHVRRTNGVHLNRGGESKAWGLDVVPSLPESSPKGSRPPPNNGELALVLQSPHHLPVGLEHTIY